MLLALLALSTLVAVVGIDMLLLGTNRNLPQIEEDRERYGSLAGNLSVDQRARHELSLGVFQSNPRALIAVALAVSGVLGIALAIFLLLASP